MAAAALSKRRGSESSPSLTRLQGGEREKTEDVKEERVTEDYLNVSTKLVCVNYRGIQIYPSITQ